MVLLRHLIGDALRRLRLRQGRTLREVSASARVSLGYLSEVERGQKEASSELLAAICAALDTPLSQVLREVSDGFALAELQNEPVFTGVIEPELDAVRAHGGQPVREQVGASATRMVAQPPGHLAGRVPQAPARAQVPVRQGAGVRQIPAPVAQPAKVTIGHGPISLGEPAGLEHCRNRDCNLCGSGCHYSRSRDRLERDGDLTVVGNSVDLSGCLRHRVVEGDSLQLTRDVTQSDAEMTMLCGLKRKLD